MVYEDTEAKFTCTATTDPEEVNNLRIEWNKDGERIDYNVAQRMFKNEMDNSLTISGTISLDTGKYTCVATNGLDEDESSAQLVVQGGFHLFKVIPKEICVCNILECLFFCVF